ncbi:MAG: hypothetical protein Q7T94_11575 [Rugosibacter sp.]|nr:hypothetical protein [Rugosibacter sp.]
MHSMTFRWPVRRLVCWVLSVGLVLSISVVHAQTLSRVVASPSVSIPETSASVAAMLQYRSVFTEYQGFNEQQILPWRGTNDAVEKIGGWRVSAREAEQAGDEDTPAPANTDAHGDHRRQP